MENVHWMRRFVIMRPMPGLIRPLNLAVAETRTTRYCWPGRRRATEGAAWVFQYTLAGAGAFQAENQTWTVPAGTGFLTGVADPRICYFYPAEGREPWKYIYLAYQDATGLSQCLTRECGWLYSLERRSGILNKLMALGAGAPAHLKLPAGQAALMVSGLLATLAEQGSASRARPTARVRLVRAAFELIEQSVAVPFNAGMLAERLGVTPEHLSRTFRAELGRGPAECIRTWKMQRAGEQLLAGQTRISDLARGVGYDSPAHFTRAFRRVMGMTPSQVRAQGRLPLLAQGLDPAPRT
ncbi:MAG: AraC family transcriptional regulator [Candidatus Marinimicrobia bacterium]|nr:AraC family transcriptional regulator [Candidatus Neomarinimicrobiota bacterium]